MADYTWAGHLAGMEKKRIQREEKKNMMLYYLKHLTMLLLKASYISKIIICFLDKYIYLDCEDYVADFYLTKYNVKIKFLAEYIIPNSKYRWIICKVPKINFHDFHCLCEGQVIQCLQEVIMSFMIFLKLLSI